MKKSSESIDSEDFFEPLVGLEGDCDLYDFQLVIFMIFMGVSLLYHFEMSNQSFAS